MSRPIRLTTMVNQPRTIYTCGRVEIGKPQPRFLQRVVGLRRRAEHAPRDGPQVRPVLWDCCVCRWFASIGHILSSASVMG